MIFKQLTLATLIGWLSTSAYADSLKLLNWEDYLSESVKQKWQEKTALPIEEIYFDNDEKRDAILINSDTHNIDIAVVDEVIAKHFGKEGRLVELNEENVPSLAHVGKFWRERCSNYAAPYFWGTLGIVYRSDKVTTPPTSWSALLQPEEHLKGHIGMMDDFTDMLAPALFFNGHSVNTTDQAELKQAFETLKKQVPHVLTYEYAISYVSASERSNELYMALAYGGDQDTLNDLAGDKGLWKYIVPKEGTVLWVDCIAAVANSNNLDQSLAFIDFINKPDIAATNAEDTYFATPNEAAFTRLPEDLKTNTEIYPTKPVIERSELYKELSNENISLRLRITNAIRNTHESRQTR